ncbi:hypothetical protein F1880_009147 [Penicillium rolfsii]|nr:hypothetical protein F1880_009147 [Penicillium rolfsii]
MAPDNESATALFVQQYRDIDMTKYQTTLNAVEEICRQVLSSHAIPHAYESRLKGLDSLEGKLAKFERRQGFHYQAIEDIKRDIVDLAGLCILVHVPSDRKRAGDILKDVFIVRKAFDHPKDDEIKEGQKKDQGYVATHLHVFLKDKDLDDHDLDHSDRKLVEIQIISTSLRAWSNREHDLIYKPKGKSTRAQRQTMSTMRSIVVLDEELHEQIEEEDAYKAAKETRSLKTLDDVGCILQKWLEEHQGAWFQGHTCGSCTSLFMFLTSRNMNTRRGLYQVLEETFGPDSEAAYSKLASQYPSGSLTLVIFIMDRLLLRNDESGVPDELSGKGHEVHVYKLRALMSTIVWLSRLFVPEFKWQQVFVGQNQESLREGLVWLSSARQDFFLEGSLLGRDDVAILEQLWGWFEHQSARQVRLAFAISKNGMFRSRSDVRKVVEPLICGLGHAH